MKGLPRSLSKSKDTSALTSTIVLKDFLVTVTKGVTSFGSALLQAVPEGNIFYQGAVANLQVSTESATVTSTFTGVVSVGTVAATAVPFTNSNLSTLDNTVIGPAVAKVTPIARGVGLRTNAGRITDNTAATDSIYLNMSITDAHISASSVFVVNGTVKILYSIIGDD